MLHDKTVELKRRIVDFVKNNTPISANGNNVTIENITIQDPPELDSIQKQLDMKYLSREEIMKGKGSLVGKVGGTIIVRNDKGDIVSKGQANKELFSIPYVTNRGTYLINGGEKSILTQLRLKPGVYTSKSPEKNTVKTNFTFDNTIGGGKYAPQIAMNYIPDTSEFKVSIKKGKKEEVFNGINFLRETGFNDTQIKKMMGNGSHADIVFEKTGNRRGKSIKDIYKHITGENPNESDDILRHKLFDYTAQNAKFGTGENVVKDNLGVKTDHFDKEVLQNAVTKMFGVAIGTHEEDDKDDLRYKDVLDDNDFIVGAFEKDFVKFKEDVLKILKASDKVKATDLTNAARGLGTSIPKFMSSGSVVQAPEQINPLYVAGNEKKITQLGDGGLNAQTVESSTRNLSKNSFGRIDPIETPESGNIGVVGHLAQEAIVKNNTIYAPVLKVRNGEATDNDSNVVELSPDDEYDSKVAYFDSRYIDKQGNKIKFLAKEVPARYQGKTITLPVSDIQYIDRKPQNIMGYAANMIPFVGHNDGNRALMGSNMQKQAILLKNRESALVTTAFDHDKKTTYDQVIGEDFGKPVRSLVDGIVHKVEDGIVHVKDEAGKIHKHEFYHWFPFNQGFIHNDVTTKVGDAVKKGDILAEGWQTKNGKLALGVNTRIGYMPYKGYNYEDGVVISENYAQKMSTEEMQKLEIDIPDNCMGGRGSNIQDELKGHTTKQAVFQNLDKDGIIKVGQYISPGSVVVGMLRDTRVNSSDELDAIRAKKKNATGLVYAPFVIPRTSYLEGKVVRVNITNNPGAGVKQKIVVTLVNSKPLKFGDKVSGRHGNKGTITKILPDKEMPIAEDGKPLDLIFSPLAIPSRKNVGQVLEAHAGLIAEKTGKPFVLNNFDHSEKERVLQGLKDIGFADGKMKVFLREEDPKTKEIKKIEVENPVTVGNMYIMKLKHKVDDKIQERSNLETYVDPKTYAPKKVVGEKQGEKHNPQSLGEMEMRALQAHGAIWNILENSTFKSDGGGDAKQRVALFNALSTGKLDKLDMPATPETLNVLADHLKGLGLKVTALSNGKIAKTFDDPFDSLKLSPMKPTEVLKMIGRENRITDHNMFTGKDEADKDIAVKGGLFDENIFGKDKDPESRKKWGYIKLPTPIANPMFIKTGKGNGYNTYEALTKLKGDDLLQLSEGKKVLITDPKKFAGFDDMAPEHRELIINQHLDNMKKAGLEVGQLLSPKELESKIAEHGRVFWKAGGDAIQHLLDGINLDERLDEAKAELDKAKGSEINKKFKQYKQLISLKENDIKPSDLMVHYVPVLPTHLRPIVREGSTLIKDDLNTLYSNLVYASNQIGNSLTEGIDVALQSNPMEAARDAGNLFKKMTDLTGHTTGKDKRTGKDLGGIKTVLGSKEGLARNMLSKRVDFSGRSVIGVDPTLKINEMGLPVDMAKYIYKPFVLKELYKQGYAKNMDEAQKKWESLDKQTVDIIKEVAADRPALLNRQPTLHKFGVQAFKPVILDKSKDGKTIRNIQLNPLVVTGFNADFDGDTMAVHAPISEKAKEEAKKLMMPSTNLINPTNGSMVVEIRHEMALGVYYLTKDSQNPKGDAINYTDYNKLKKDFMTGVIKADQKVNIAGHQGISAGSAIYNLILPEKYRDFKKTWNAKNIQGMLRDMYEDAEANKGISKMEISGYMDKIKDIGFEASTKSGVSLGINDFKSLDFSKTIKDSIDEMKNKVGNTEQAVILGYKKAEDKIQDILKDSDILSPDNPLKMMMVSGARAKPDQIRRMMVTVGVGMDLNKQLTAPVLHSHLDGLAPQEYWLHSHDSRKGMADRSVSTQEPGALTREVWSATQDNLIKEEDCGTMDGIELRSGDKSILGRFAATDVIGGNGNVYVRRNQLITKDIQNKIYQDDSVQKIKVRSPLRCKAVGGVCQKCYGTTPGTTQVPELGTAVGVLASQALGEPVMQMTMNTFHSGGTSSKATLGLPRIKQLLNLSEDHSNPAILSKISGTVTKIEQDLAKPFDIVHIDKTPHVIPHTSDNQSKMLRVKEGDKITKGDFITVGDVYDLDIEKDEKDSDVYLTNAHPKTLFDLKADVHGMENALNYVKDYVTSGMEYTFKKTVGNDAIDRKHLETIVGKLGSKATIMDPGDSNFLRGQDIDKNEIDKWNTENSSPYSAKSVSLSTPANIIGRKAAETVRDKSGNILIGEGQEITSDIVGKLLATGSKKTIKIMPRPVEYKTQMHSQSTVIDKGHDNWLSNISTKDVFKHLTHGAATNQIDTLNDPRTRVMTGKLLNVGEGFKLHENAKTKDKTNSIASKMYNFFTDPFK